MTQGRPAVCGALVSELSVAMTAAGEGLVHAPRLLRRVLEETAWREFVIDGSRVAHRDFLSFVIASPPRGLGATVGTVRRLTGGDPVIVDLLEQALQQSTASAVDNINEPIRPTGTSQAAALRRLRKDAPTLHDRVLTGEMSAHAAMVEAGFRARTVTVPLSRPETAARVLRSNLTPDELAQLITLLAAPAP
ncbi:hypothetical protein [Actinocorallia longicatena]|uniref:Uncharacterized protein n=1 Tax=Actinocorallia longicatena TaxID=111803 RepID=A0ABP6QGE1_9ACTN